MKVKYLWASLIALTFFSCDDNTDSLGLSMMPDSDNISIAAKTYNVTTETIAADSVFAKTSMGYLGKYTDPKFGLIEADFITQLTCTDQFVFPIERMAPVDDKAQDKTYAVAASINLYYSSYFGSGSNANRLSIYQLNKDITKDNFSDYLTTSMKPSDYYDSKSEPLLKKAYSAIDLSVDEAVRNSATYYPSISIKFPLDKANQCIKLFQDCQANHKNFKEEFTKAFKGLYIKCDYGDGTILYVDQVNLNISFNVYAMQADGKTRMKKLAKGHETEDSTYVTAAQFGSTKEVVQATHFKNDVAVLDPAADYTYIKSPAGLFTKVDLPVDQLITDMEALNSGSSAKIRRLNAVRIAFEGFNKPTDTRYAMGTPSRLLLLKKKDLYSFFKNNQLPDNKTSFLSTIDPSAPNRYLFANIANYIDAVGADYRALIQDRKKLGADVAAINAKLSKLNKDNELVLVPVVVDTDKSQNNNLVSVRHDLKPSYLQLKGGKSPLKLEVIYSTVKK